MTKILRDPASASFSPKHQMRNHMNLAVVREIRLKQSSERDKSIQISGVKMFDPQQFSRSALKINRQSNRDVTSHEKSSKFDQIRKNIEAGAL